jgi:hypothetical protein
LPCANVGADHGDQRGADAEHEGNEKIFKPRAGPVAFDRRITNTFGQASLSSVGAIGPISSISVRVCSGSGLRVAKRSEPHAPLVLDKQADIARHSNFPNVRDFMFRDFLAPAARMLSSFPG